MTTTSTFSFQDIIDADGPKLREMLERVSHNDVFVRRCFDAHNFDAQLGLMPSRETLALRVALVQTVRCAEMMEQVQHLHANGLPSITIQLPSSPNIVKAQTWLKWLWQSDKLTKEQDTELEVLINAIDDELAVRPKEKT